jgi:hypothetical protein
MGIYRTGVTFGALIGTVLLISPVHAGDPIPVCLTSQGTMRLVEFNDGCRSGETKKLFDEWEEEVEDPPEEEEAEEKQEKKNDPAQEQLEERMRILSKQVSELSARLAALESNTSNTSKRTSNRVTAPFEVVSRGGKVILRVAEKVSSASGEGAHVTIGAGDWGNYSLRIHRGGGQLVAGIGQSREGSGLVLVNDNSGQIAANLNGRDRKVSVFNGEQAAASMAAEGKAGTIAVYDGSTAVAYLTRSSHGGGGNLTLATSAGFGVFSAGAASDGGGEACLNRVTGSGKQRNVCLGVELPSMGLGK